MPAPFSGKDRVVLYANVLNIAAKGRSRKELEGRMTRQLTLLTRNNTITVAPSFDKSALEWKLMLVVDKLATWLTERLNVERTRIFRYIMKG